MMKVAHFDAVDSVTGDYFNGIVYDNTNKYHVGDTFTFANDLGGNWTYSIVANLVADSTHQNPFYAGKVYDTFYFDASRGIGAITNSGFLGYNYGAPTDLTNYSGANYLGSDGDYVVLNGVTHRFAFNHPVSTLTSVVDGNDEPLQALLANAASSMFVFEPVQGMHRSPISIGRWITSERTASRRFMSLSYPAIGLEGAVVPDIAPGLEHIS